jgi:uncharacterized alpha/beta hydrolase family protein
MKKIFLFLMIAMALAVMLGSCATTKTGCPDSARWERKTAFNK